MHDARLIDDRGPFWSIGATYMAAAWFYKHDRARLNWTLDLLSGNGIGYIRVLGAVGGEYWNGRETDPRWPDYDETIEGLTDLAYTRYGMRVQWTIFGDTGFTPSVEARAALVDRFASMAVERPQAIMLLEIANEGWQNGFSGETGTAELHALTRRLQGRLRQRRLGIPVAPTSPEGADCESWLRMYRGSGADVATMHFERSTSDDAGPWLPAILPWTYRACEGMPAVGVNNEPIGPGSSVVDDENPTRLVTSAAISVISGIPLYAFHTRAGIRGDIAFAEVPNVRQTFDGFAALRRTLPPAAATGRAFDLRTPGQPMQLISPSRAEEGSEGVLAGYGTVLGDGLYGVLAGIKGGARLRSNRAMEVEVIEPLTGRTTRRLTVEAGTTFDVTATDAALLRARLQ